MVADFTGRRQGVYFEVGMMLGLGRTVIWMCKDEELAASHFDTRQYNFINYESAEEAQKRVRPNHGNPAKSSPRCSPTNPVWNACARMRR